MPGGGKFGIVLKGNQSYKAVKGKGYFQAEETAQGKNYGGKSLRTRIGTTPECEQGPNLYFDAWIEVNSSSSTDRLGILNQGRLVQRQDNGCYSSFLPFLHAPWKKAWVRPLLNRSEFK